VFSRLERSISGLNCELHLEKTSISQDSQGFTHDLQRPEAQDASRKFKPYRRNPMNQVTKIAALGITLSSLASIASAQPQISPQSIIVNPVDNTLSVRVTTDRGGSNPVYNIGDPIRVSVNVNQDAYVYLFSVHSDGKVDLILPNKLSGGNAYLRANETRTFPPSGAAYQLNVDGPSGQDKVLAVASKRQLNLNEISGQQPVRRRASSGSGQPRPRLVHRRAACASLGLGDRRGVLPGAGRLRHGSPTQR
jgi:Domain of unknown function (DUF4384)